MRKSDWTRMLWVFGLSFFISGCSIMLHEKKATETDTGTATNLKMDGQKVKVVHSF